MIITISGTPGSGKGTVAKFLCEKLGFRRYSIGDFMGEIALQRGLSLMELSLQAEKDRSIDEILDEKQIYLGEHEDDFVIDSRLGWHWMPHSFKIFLKCSPEVAAQRIFKDKRADEEENTTLKKTLENIKRRCASEKTRYKKYYGLDPNDEQQYDYALDTSEMTKEQVLSAVLKTVLQAKNKTFK